MELRRIQRRSASPAPAEHGEEPAPASAVRALLLLQRGAGNVAVTQLVGERTLARGQGSSTAGGPRRYWLMIGDLQIPMTLTRGYFRFDAAPRSYIHNNSELKIDEATSQITVNNPDYAEQIARFCNGNLQLWRGITRQHPLFYEVDQVHIVLPLGTGELPDFDTNKTSFIPFGHSEGSAKGIAIGKRGMGPGDELRMIANYPALRALGTDLPIGGVICVTAGFGGADAGFYNSGEIQVRGPLTEFTWTPVKQGEFGDAAGLDAVPSESDTAKYTAEHGLLRHALIEQALATAGPAGQERLTQARASGGKHAQQLMMMRKLVELTLEDDLKRLAGGNSNYFNRLDSSVNREAHAGYLAAVIGGAPMEEAIDRGLRAATDWLSAHGEGMVERARAAEKAAAEAKAVPH